MSGFCVELNDIQINTFFESGVIQVGPISQLCRKFHVTSVDKFNVQSDSICNVGPKIYKSSITWLFRKLIYFSHVRTYHLVFGMCSIFIFNSIRLWNLHNYVTIWMKRIFLNFLVWSMILQYQKFLLFQYYKHLIL